MRARRVANLKRFQNLTFEDFRRLAKDERLTSYEKIGFPIAYRKGYEKFIFRDIASKLKSLKGRKKVIADIGCGCSRLAFRTIQQCRRNRSRLLLVDSEEMLSHLPNGPMIEKFPCRFPHCKNIFSKYSGKVDGVLIYSVLQHVFLESNVFDFIDRACELLKIGGEILIGDIPNISMRNRFFSSNTGIEFHRKCSGAGSASTKKLFRTQENRIDDGIVFGILQRYRNFGYHTYLLPQDERLPMANRREDILIKKL